MQTINTETKRELNKRTQASRVKRILLIDDKNDSGLSSALAQEGCDVTRCGSVQKAWSLVYPQRPHLIIIHLDKSKKAGLADLQECRALAEGIPIILAASAQVNETLMKDLQHRAAPILGLPLAPGTIRKALNDLEPSTMRRQPSADGRAH